MFSFMQSTTKDLTLGFQMGWIVSSLFILIYRLIICVAITQCIHLVLWWQVRTRYKHFDRFVFSHQPTRESSNWHSGQTSKTVATICWIKGDSTQHNRLSSRIQGEVSRRHGDWNNEHVRQGDQRIQTSNWISWSVPYNNNRLFKAQSAYHIWNGT